jgi:hypothetical protein
MSKQTEELCTAIRDTIYFIKKGDVEKGVNILIALLKKFSPAAPGDNDPQPR